MQIIIKNGHVIDPKNNISAVMDVIIQDGVIVAVGEPADGEAIKIDKKNAKIIDAKGMYVVPGLIDAHCHLRDPGFEYKEDIETGTRSAAKGGFTSVACMPNTSPVIDNKTVIAYIK